VGGEGGQNEWWGGPPVRWGWAKGKWDRWDLQGDGRGVGKRRGVQGEREGRERGKRSKQSIGEREWDRENEQVRNKKGSQRATAEKGERGRRGGGNERTAGR